jgi:glycosyltransferase involved in cell wall biosynthesis
VLIVSGIWPPDVGGPASHAPEVADYLQSRGHTPRVLVTADAAPASAAYRVDWVSRRLPTGVRHAIATLRIARLARTVDIVYSTGMFARSALATTLARRPLVIKLTGDPAFERARWRGAVAGDLEDFEQHRGAFLAALRALRAWTLRRAALVVCPSRYLQRLALSWGVPAERVTVVRNPAPEVGELPPREELRRALGLEGVALVYAGRFGPQKALANAVEAVESVDGVSLAVAGAGDAEPALVAASERGRVRLLGSQSRPRVLELLAAADAMVLPSRWENLPHTVLESLAVGTPVIASDVGGVPEMITDGENGLLVPPGDVRALTAAITSFRDDAALRTRLRTGARASVADLSRDRVYGELEALLERARR